MREMLKRPGDRWLAVNTQSERGNSRSTHIIFPCRWTQRDAYPYVCMCVAQNQWLTSWSGYKPMSTQRPPFTAASSADWLEENGSRIGWAPAAILFIICWTDCAASRFICWLMVSDRERCITCICSSRRGCTLRMFYWHGNASLTCVASV